MEYSVKNTKFSGRGIKSSKAKVVFYSATSNEVMLINILQRSKDEDS